MLNRANNVRSVHTPGCKGLQILQTLLGLRQEGQTKSVDEQH